MQYEPKYLDFALSPCTGMTRKSWLDAARYLLEGVFQHIGDMEQPVVVPRQETKITYPHADAPEAVRKAEEKAEIFEGLTRSFFIAAPLIQEDPETELCGIRIRDYYKHQVLRSCTPGDELYVGSYGELQELTGHADPFRTFQQTVETCALVICLWLCREKLWATYTRQEQDVIAALLDSYARANTVPQNWRLFNMLDMAFLYREGYAIEKNKMLDHAQAILEYYVGDGWYRDGQCFDYYSCWAFNFYAPLWNAWYGYEHEPWLARKFEEHSNRLMATYGDFFDRDGYTNMWGRSNIYRFAAVSAFDGNLFLRDSTVDPGVARRICSGSLLQFLTRDDFLWNGIPSMGFYRQFSPLVQGYSCAESPFWMGKAFACLHLPADHPFWTAEESLGSWESLSPGQVKETVLNGPALAFTNHERNGETILRSGKVIKHRNDFHGMWNYAKLSYNTKYPWESTPKAQEVSTGDGKKVDTGCAGVCGRVWQTGDIESQQYVLLDVTGGYRSLCNATLWGGERDGVLYRRQYFDYTTRIETHWMQGMFLADFPVAEGILRADKVKLFRRPVMLTLGSYGFPDNGTQIRRCEKDGAKAIVLKGYDSQRRPRQLAMTIFDGFSDIGCIASEGTNPDSGKSLVIFACAGLHNQYDGHEHYVFVSQTITRESHEDFTGEELFPVEEIRYTDEAGRGTYGPVEILLRSGERRVVDYGGLEGALSC